MPVSDTAAGLVAKAFGGGNITQVLQRPIGERNAQFACDWLRQDGIAPVAPNLGGRWSRKVIFETRTGDADCRRRPVQSGLARRAVREEAQYAARLNRASTERRVALF